MSLMPGARIYRPGMWSMFRNLINGELTMKKNIDPNFTWVDFMKGATQAATLVSNQIADGNFYELQGIVTPEAVDEIKENTSKLSITDRERIRIHEDQILFKWANSSDFSGGQGSPWRVSIMTVYHTLPGHHNRYASSLEEFDVLAKAIVRIANIRFTAQFVDGESDGWIIDFFNSFDDDSNYPPMKKQS